MAVTKEDVLEFISNLSVLELSELVKEFEEKFGVSAQPVAVAGGAVAAVYARLTAKLRLPVNQRDSRRTAGRGGSPRLGV